MKFDPRKCNSNQKQSNNMGLCECKNQKEYHLWERNYIWNLAICTYKHDKYLGSTIGDSVISYREVIKVTKTIPTKTIPRNFNEKRVTCKIKKNYMLYSLSNKLPYHN